MCLRVFNDKLLVKAKASPNAFDLAESLILLARIEMELGMFPKAEAHLNELQSLLTEKESDLKLKDDSHYFKL